MPYAAKDFLAQQRGAGGVVFLTDMTMLRALSLEGEMAKQINVPVISTVAGDARRVALAVAKWSETGESIQTHAWANRLIGQSWDTYRMLEDHSNWPHDTESRRRLVHRLLRSAGKSLPQREAIVAAAAKAEESYRRLRSEEL